MNRIAPMILVYVLLLGPGVATSQAALMYATSASAGQLWTVDTDTAATTLIGGTPAGASLTCAYDIAENRIYTFDNATNELYSIDSANGTGFAVGVLDYNFVQGFAYDPINDILYAHDKDTGSLFTINTTDASTTFIGFTNWGWAGGIEYDFINEILYGLEMANYAGGGARLGTINTSTGAVTVVGAVSSLTGLQLSLGFNPQDGMLYTSVERDGPYDGTYDLVRINPTTLATSIVGTTSKRLSGLSFMEVPEPATMSLLGFGALGLIARRKKRK